MFNSLFLVLKTLFYHTERRTDFHVLFSMWRRNKLKDDKSGVTLYGSLLVFFPRLDSSTFWTLLLHKAVFVKASSARWTAPADVGLKRKDYVFFSAELTDETSGQTQLTVFNMSDGQVQQRSGLRHQLTLLHLQQVVHGEEVRLLHQVSRKLI